MHIVLFNIYAYSVLGYLIQLADPPRCVMKRYDHCLQLLNKGPYHGIPTAIIQYAKKVGGLEADSPNINATRSNIKQS